MIPSPPEQPGERTGSTDAKDIWGGLAERTGLPRRTAEEFWREIEIRYGGPGRHYHTMDHIRRMLTDWRRLRDVFDRRDEVAMAVFYHDIVYEVRGKANEEMSARLARERMASCRRGTVDSGRVAAMVLATADHLPTGDADTDLFLDMDLAILAAESAEYSRYTESIREEHSEMSDDAYRSGRSLFLESFLARPFIYASPTGRREWEKRARRNLHAELERLSNEDRPFESRRRTESASSGTGTQAEARQGIQTGICVENRIP